MTRNFMQRNSGILLHPSALPGQYGIGDLGKEARIFINFLASAGQAIWQILPLGPPGYGASPYNALSAFAGNPLLIDLHDLVACHDLEQEDLDKLQTADTDHIDFDRIRKVKTRLLNKAGRVFFENASTERQQTFEIFCHQQAEWLDDFSLFMALREHFSGQSWNNWPKELRSRNPVALGQWRKKLFVSCRLHQYQQYIFAEQWSALKKYANDKSVRIFGDIPIFVAYDSAEVWANQTLFQLDAQGQPTVVAGVPPDYFSETGQRWGNPLYRWDRLAESNFHWWLKRFNYHLEATDMIRIDHFRGFQACWSIPAVEATAVNGQWEAVPGCELFRKLCDQHPNPPIIAEDLGIITPEVEALRDEFNFPGMKILQFAFDSGPDNPYLPSNHIPNSVVYTGTHDNNTTVGWWQSLTKSQKNQVRKHLGQNQLEMPWSLIHLAMGSAANLCIIPCQDILGLGKDARFNTPGQATGNWSWRLSENSLTVELANHLYSLTEKYRRLPHQ